MPIPKNSSYFQAFRKLLESKGDELFYPFIWIHKYTLKVLSKFDKFEKTIPNVKMYTYSTRKLLLLSYLDDKFAIKRPSNEILEIIDLYLWKAKENEMHRKGKYIHNTPQYPDSIETLTKHIKRISLNEDPLISAFKILAKSSEERKKEVSDESLLKNSPDEAYVMGEAYSMYDKIIEEICLKAVTAKELEKEEKITEEVRKRNEERGKIQSQVSPYDIAYNFIVKAARLGYHLKKIPLKGLTLDDIEEYKLIEATLSGKIKLKDVMQFMLETELIRKKTQDSDEIEDFYLYRPGPNRPPIPPNQPVLPNPQLQPSTSVITIEGIANLRKIFEIETVNSSKDSNNINVETQLLDLGNLDYPTEEPQSSSQNFATEIEIVNPNINIENLLDLGNLDYPTEEPQSSSQNFATEIEIVNPNININVENLLDLGNLDYPTEEPQSPSQNFALDEDLENLIPNDPDELEGKLGNILMSAIEYFDSIQDITQIEIDPNEPRQQVQSIDFDDCHPPGTTYTMATKMFDIKPDTKK